MREWHTCSCGLGQYQCVNTVFCLIRGDDSPTAVFQKFGASAVFNMGLGSISRVHMVYYHLRKTNTQFLPSSVYNVVGERDEVIYTKYSVMAFITEVMPGF